LEALRMNVYDLIGSIESEIDDARGREERARGELENLIGGVEGQGRRNLTAEEDRRAEALFKDVDLASPDHSR
jgi:hypothetical protein